MGKERWTIILEGDVIESPNYLWPHMVNNPHIQIRNEDDGITEIFLDGIHRHSHCTCSKELEWKVVKREKTE